VIALPSNDGKSHDIDEWTTLGPDPLVEGVDAKWLSISLHSTKRTIKEALLDQTIIAGLGNIQVTEALWRARIDPRTPANRLDDRTISRLAQAIRKSIAATLAKEDGPEIAYVEEAGAENPFKVYGRGGEPCPRCRTSLIRVVLGGRGTVYCPHCQQGQRTSARSHIRS